MEILVESGLKLPAFLSWMFMDHTGWRPRMAPKQRKPWEVHPGLTVSPFSALSLIELLSPPKVSGVVVPCLSFPSPPQLALQTPGA